MLVTTTTACKCNCCNIQCETKGGGSRSNLMQCFSQLDKLLVIGGFLCWFYVCRMIILWISVLKVWKSNFLAWQLCHICLNIFPFCFYVLLHVTKYRNNKRIIAIAGILSFLGKLQYTTSCLNVKYSNHPDEMKEKWMVVQIEFETVRSRNNSKRLKASSTKCI